jgi:LacI family transcriptional regulator
MDRDSITVHDVARHAQVSIATVSRVMRGVGQVSSETRRRVLAAIDELHYRPSHFGRALVERRHAALGIVFPGLSGPYYSELISGFEAEAIQSRQSLLILGTHLLEHSDELVLDLASRVDGLAIMGGTIADETVQHIASSGVPVVLLARRQLADLSTVRVDNLAATRALTRHLLVEHGYRQLAFIGNPQGSPDVSDRWQGFLAAHNELAISPPGEPVRVGFQPPDGFAAATALFAAPSWPQALVCANDELALGVYSAAAARRIVIPDQLAVTGWDDIAMAALLTPPLTTIRQPIRELGARSAQWLLTRIHDSTVDSIDLVLETECIIRASCGCHTKLE